MSRVTALHRRSVGAKKLDLTDLRHLIRQIVESYGWDYLGRVFAPAGTGSHWEKDEKGRVLVEVETLPEQMDLTCRLGSYGGMWMVPPVGALVGVIVPSGKPDHMPIIVGILDGNNAPERVSDERVVWAPGVPIEVESDDVKITSDAITMESGDVRLGGSSATQAAPLGTSQKLALDTFLAQLAAALSTMVNPSFPALMAMLSDGGTLMTTLVSTGIPQLIAANYLSPKVKVS